jgi:hypothetical protein
MVMVAWPLSTKWANVGWGDISAAKDIPTQKNNLLLKKALISEADHG